MNQHKSGNPFDIFVVGARKGFTVATQNLMPNVLMAYTIAQILTILVSRNWISCKYDSIWTVTRYPCNDAISGLRINGFSAAIYGTFTWSSRCTEKILAAIDAH